MQVDYLFKHGTVITMDMSEGLLKMDLWQLRKPIVDGNYQ